MKLTFEANLEYQIQAIDSIVNLFEGQTKDEGVIDFSFITNDNTQLFNEINAIRNNLTITNEQIYDNLCKIQKANEIDCTSKENFQKNGLNFTVEMETGTGKTYVYLRTIYELNKKYGFKKFVIVVPSIAIREGVLKNLEITFEHFQNLYDNVPVNYYVYDSGKVSILRSFATNNNIEILVINIDSFAKDGNIINRPEAYKAGYKTIADIAKERIRRAGNKIKQELQEEAKKKAGQIQFEPQEEKKVDTGFKVFKLDESNFKQWRPFRPENAEQIKQAVLEFSENVKPDATTENMLYELMLKNGKKLTDKIEKKESFYVVNENELVLLLEDINKNIIDEVLKLKPQKVIALDKIFNGNDQLKTNTVLQFKDAAIEFKSV